MDYQEPLESPPWPDDPVERRRAIELELKRIRSEASVARLEARAAELELMLRDLDTEATDQTIAHFESWDEVAAAQSAAKARLLEKTKESSVGFPNPSRDTGAITRIDAPHRLASLPHFAPVKSDHAIYSEPPDYLEPPDYSELPDESPLTEQFVVDPGDQTVDPPIDIPLQVAGDDAVDVSESVKRRSRPIAITISTVLHLLLLIVLGFATLSLTEPKDQIALTAAPSTPSEESIETLTVDTTELEVAPEETPTRDVEYDFNPVGEIVAAKFSPTPNEEVGKSTAAAKAIRQATASTMPLDASPSDTEPIEFCGIAGGGNHFVYLVDSSKSMGDAFASARLELLRSISALRPDQRFYVVFFDENTDYMRLVNSTRDEPQSVLASTENKELLRRWAMRVTMDRGRAPYDALRFALGLRPDVIFLLSDGEFPKSIEEILEEENRVENLFGDSKPISIVHTIGYHSRQGEARMRRIAAANQGQYRYVPEP